MGAVHGWMDESEVRRLAEGLMAAAPVANPGGYTADFVGFAELDESPEGVGEAWQGAPTASQEVADAPRGTIPNLASGALARASERAREAGLLRPVAAAAEAPAASLTERLAVFRGWLASEFGASEVYLVDREGQVVFDGLSQSKGGEFARNLARAACRASREAAAGALTAPVRLKLGQGSMLEVFSLETLQGVMVMAALVPVAIASAALGGIAAELAKVLGDERRV
jgi:hypothetical protein